MARVPEAPTIRCSWVDTNDPHSVVYHDTEWGVPVHDDRVHFEYLTLESAQAGLSWRTVLHKREGYRTLFDQFDLEKIHLYNEQKVITLCQDPRIIRNRAKIKAAISNAAVFLSVQQQYGSFDSYVWAFTEGKIIVNTFSNASDSPTHTPLSEKISKDLKQRGMRFIGSTIIYAYLQAVGIVNDHEVDCFRKHNITSEGP